MNAKKFIDTTQLRLAVSKGRSLSQIDNVQWTVAKFKKRLSDPLVDTSITVEKYFALRNRAKGKADSAKQAQRLILEKKQMAGNYMAASYAEKRRRKEFIRAKTAVILDIDTIDPDQLADIRNGLTEISGFAWFMHTTRSHAPENPKVRLIIWVNREMTLDESNAIHRLLALHLADDPGEAISLVDPVSYKPNQTLFWPSISDGQEFWTDENIAPILDVNAFLADNKYWRDHTKLPYHPTEKKSGHHIPGTKMQDPREKPGVIGAFCRAYGIEAAIEKFLPEIYTPFDDSTERRYTYADGSSFGGAVIYEDLFLTSWHGSDDAEGTHNAWDLVRIHLFGKLDERVNGNTSPSNLPSFKAMVDLCNNDDAVRIEARSQFDLVLNDMDDADEHGNEVVPQKSGDLSDELDDLLDEDDGLDDEAHELLGLKPPPKKKKRDKSWLGDLITKANGALEPRLNNAVLFAENDRRSADCIGYNELTLNPVAFKPIRAEKMHLPSPPLERADRERGFRPWIDADDISLKRILSAPASLGGYEVEMPRSTIEEAVLIAGKRHAFHPIRDEFKRCHQLYLDNGKATEGAIEQIPQRFLGCPDDEFHRQSSFYVMLGMVFRTYEPGGKFDPVAIIRGAQGGGKGLFWNTLAHGYFTQLPTRFDDVSKMVEAMRGNLIGELGEMAGLRRETAEIAKDFITRTKDQLRLAYGRREGVYPRQCIMVGTSNLDDILHDPTGNRRFWIWVDTHDENDPIDIEGLAELRPMLWGEAYDRYLKMREDQPRGHVRLDLHSAEARAGRDRLAESFRKRTATEDIADALRDWLDEVQPACEVLKDGDGMALDGYADDDTPMVRNLVNANMAWAAIKDHPAVNTYRNAGAATCGSALSQIKDLTPLGRCRRLGERSHWFYRFADNGQAWVPLPAEQDEDDLLA